MFNPLFVIKDSSNNEVQRGQRYDSEAENKVYNDYDTEMPVMTGAEKSRNRQQTLTSTVDVNSTLLLKFQQTILRELIILNSLLVLSKGLGLESIVANLLHVLSTPSSSFVTNNNHSSNNSSANSSSNYSSNSSSGLRSKRSLTILLNALDEENAKIGEELTELSWTDAFSDPVYSDTVPNSSSSDNSRSNYTGGNSGLLKRQFILIKGESIIVKKRRKLYSKGGIISISSRIFIVDLLSGIVDPNMITGLVILHADKISETSNESFIINFYRSKNKWGFIKCLTDEPQSLLNTAYSSSGGSVINPLRSMLRNMQLKKCLLWPRFHIDVIKSLSFRPNKPATTNAKENDKCLGKVIEIKVAMTKSMQTIQLAIISCMKALLFEIKRHNPELTAESELFEDLGQGNAFAKVNADIFNENEFSKFLDDFFLKQVMALFNPSWHRISWTTKQLIGDLAMLGRLLGNLIDKDAISFYEDIELILHEYKRSKIGGRMNYSGSPWLMLDEASTVISFAKKRVFDNVKDQLTKSDDQNKDGGHGSDRTTMPTASPFATPLVTPSTARKSNEKSLLLEELPKWKHLAVLLHDIIGEKLHNGKLQNDGPILIMCSSAQTVAQIRQFLTSITDEINSSGTNIKSQPYSGRRMMLNRFRDYSYWGNNSIRVTEKISKIIKENEANRKARFAASNSSGPSLGPANTTATNNSTDDNHTNINRNSYNDNNTNSNDNDGKREIFSTPNPQEEHNSSDGNKINASKTFTAGAQPIGKRRKTGGGSNLAPAEKSHNTKFSQEENNEAISKQIKKQIEEEVNDWTRNGKQEVKQEKIATQNVLAELVEGEGEDGDNNVDGDETNEAENLVEEVGVRAAANSGNGAGLYVESQSLYMQVEPPNVYELVSRQEQIIVEKYDSKTDEKIINELFPSYIIMYEPNLSFVRRVELFQAENNSHKLKTFLMYYGASVEEQRYLSQIEKEKESFTKLIKEKGQLSEEFKDNQQGVNDHITNSRIDGENKRFLDGKKIYNRKIVIDIREFRSALPNVLFRAGFEIVPCVITVGDYILSPRICVERKSVPDLISSFEKGHLYSQCTRMFRYYEIVILLIEFDETKSFALNPFVEFKNLYDRTLMKSKVKDSIASEKSQQNIRLKLSMLLLSFPKLTIIWSPSPYHTAEIYKELIIFEENPDIGNAITAGLDGTTSIDIGIASASANDSKNLISEIQFNDNAIDLIKNIPGITAGNYHIIIQHVRSVRELAMLEDYELALLVGEENGKKIFNFFRQNIVPELYR